jgi:hypothetical protein
MNVVAQLGGLNAIILTNDELYLLTAVLGGSDEKYRKKSVETFGKLYCRDVVGVIEDINSHLYSEMTRSVSTCVPSNRVNPLWATTSAKCRQFMDKGEIVKAIKQYNEDNGCGLYEAKQAIDVLMTEQLVPPT